MVKKNLLNTVLFTAYGIFLLLSYLFSYQPGKDIAYNFIDFAVDMFRILPCAFILIGLFEVWVRKETIERHMGENSALLGYLWAVLLAGTTVGGLYVAFPVAHSIYKKGAKLSCVFTYIGAAAVCRIPMTVFEASFLGVKFSLIRLLVSLPFIIITSRWLGEYLERNDYKLFTGSINCK